MQVVFVMLWVFLLNLSTQFKTNPRFIDHFDNNYQNFDRVILK